MSGTLPWMDSLSKPEPVHTAKKTFFSDIRGSLATCFGQRECPGNFI